jgi:hypothetical protein
VIHELTLQNFYLDKPIFFSVAVTQEHLCVDVSPRDYAMDVDSVRLQELNNLLKTLKVNNKVEDHSLIISIDLGTSYSGYVEHSLLSISKPGCDA